MLVSAVHKNFKHKIPTPIAGGMNSSSGFSLFELIVFIIVSAIIYASASNRFAQFPAEAERANFLAVQTQIQAAVNLEMMMGFTSGKTSSMTLLIGTNPMELLLKPPSNYVGAINGAVDGAGIPGRSWYFNGATGELVYRVSNPDGVFLNVGGTQVPTNEIKFRIEADYGDIDVRSGLPVSALESGGQQVPRGNRTSKFNGVLMQPVLPFSWQTEGIDVNAVDT